MLKFNRSQEIIPFPLLNPFPPEKFHFPKNDKNRKIENNFSSLSLSVVYKMSNAEALNQDIGKIMCI